MPGPSRILLVIDSLTAGGAESFVYQLCKYIHGENIRLSVCALHSGGLYQEKIESLNIPVHMLSPDPKPFRMPSIAVKLFGLLGSQKFDLIHTFLQASFMIGTPLARIRQIPCVHSVMATRRQTQKWYFPLMKYYQRWVELYLTFCPRELKDAGINEEKIKEVEISLDLSPMLALQHNPKHMIDPYIIDEEALTALSVGRLHPDKGHEFAIKAWPIVLKVFPNAKLLILGEGEDEYRLKNMTHQLNLENSVFFTGFRRDLDSFFIRADAFLRTSLNEGVNLTTIQAMASGVPVIGFNNNAPKQIIRHRINGLLCEISPEAMAKTVIDLFQDASRNKMTETAKKLICAYYDIQGIAEFHKALYDRAGGGVPLKKLPDMHGIMSDFEKHFSGLS